MCHADPSVVASSPVCAGKGEAVRQHRPLTPARFLHRTGPYVSDAGGSDGHGRTTAADVSRATDHTGPNGRGSEVLKPIYERTYEFESRAGHNESRSEAIAVKSGVLARSLVRMIPAQSTSR